MPTHDGRPEVIRDVTFQCDACDEDTPVAETVRIPFDPPGRMPMCVAPAIQRRRGWHHRPGDRRLPRRLVEPTAPRRRPGGARSCPSAQLGVRFRG